MREKSTKLSLSCAALLFLCMLACVVCVASARTIYVPDDYERIQWAVDNASAGDTIIVRDGIYYEHVNVNKQLTLKSENGSANCIVDAGGSGSPITLNADGISIEGFTVRNSGSGPNAGIKVYSSNNRITGNIISNNGDGISLWWYSSNNRITDNNISNNGNGISLLDSSNNRITDNNISNNGYGIYLLDSSNNRITDNNIISNNLYGIFLLDSSNNNSITDNNISNNEYGIFLVDSSNNCIRNNIFINDGVVIRGNELQDYTHVIENNTVNGRPLYYFKDRVGGKAPEDAGQVILANCTGFLLENLNISNTNGIIIGFSSQNIITNNNISSNNEYGILLDCSSNNSIAGNNISNNEYGIRLAYSSNNRITDNIISNNWDGISLWYSSNNNSITDNNIISNNLYGIFLLDSSNNNSITDNNISNNLYGIFLLDSSNNSIRNNIFINDGVVIRGNELQDYTHVIENNTVNGRPLYYFKDRVGGKAPEDAGQVILANCTGFLLENLNISNTNGIIIGFSSQNIITNNNISSNNEYGILLDCSSNNSITDNIISNNDDGIYLRYSSNNRITDNNISNNWDGICLRHSSNNNCITDNIISSNNGEGIELGYLSNNNSITDNNISNNGYGIYLRYSSNNSIYLNNFIDNRDNVCSYDSANIWNSTEEITYTYNGKTYTSYLGNYWSDYTGSDADGDGIGDTPYIIDGDKDNYPLMERFENYFVPTPVQIFDTGRPENPYPSISGEFIGKIKTNKKIIATKLYTYPCEGTGGHTEYAIICNKTWCAEAYWKGYEGDWMNISFNRTVFLMPYDTYNITIVTGSYPQIHHTHSLKTENGWINCTEFTDANGNKYNDWIPAIKLWFSV